MFVFGLTLAHSLTHSLTHTHTHLHTHTHALMASPRLVLIDGEIRTDIEQRGILDEEDNLYMSIRDEGQTDVWYEDEFFKDMKRKDLVKYLIE